MTNHLKTKATQTTELNSYFQTQKLSNQKTTSELQSTVNMTLGKQILYRISQSHPSKSQLGFHKTAQKTIHTVNLNYISRLYQNTLTNC